MGLLKRIFWYAVGIGIGVLFVMAWLSERSDISCSYFPDSRVKHNILSKKINFEAVSQFMFENGMDSSAMKQILIDGDVIFSKSDTKLDSCKIYFIENPKLEVRIQNCDSTASFIYAKLK